LKYRWRFIDYMNDRDEDSFQIPKYFFITSGKAVNKISELNAFDEALMDAGIAQCNLVPVSSIIPSGAVEVEYVEITPGTITFCVLAKELGGPGEMISAGIAWGFGVDDRGLRYGIVAEAHGHVNREELLKELKATLHRMAEARRMKLSKADYRVEVIERVPDGHYGCVLVAFVFVPKSEESKIRAKEGEH